MRQSNFFKLETKLFILINFHLDYLLYFQLLLAASINKLPNIEDRKFLIYSEILNLINQTRHPWNSITCNSSLNFMHRRIDDLTLYLWAILVGSHMSAQRFLNASSHYRVIFREDEE